MDIERQRNGKQRLISKLGEDEQMTKDEYQDLLLELGIIYSVDYEKMTYNDCKVLLKSVCKYVDDKAEKEKELRKKDYEMVLKLSKFIDNYVDKHKLLPTKQTVYKHGFKESFIKTHYGSLEEFYKSLGYENMKIGRGKNNKYIVYDTFTNEIVMTGTIKEIHKKLFNDLSEEGFRVSVWKKCKVKKRYLIERND